MRSSQSNPESTAAGGAPSPAYSPPPDAPAAPPVYTHRVEMYGATISHTFDHTAAMVTMDGRSESYVSEPGAEPSAFAQARDFAKAAWKEREAESSTARTARLETLLADARRGGAN